MRIKRIQLKNGYKRFLDLTIDLGENPKKIVALVGPNGSGKSSVFDGMLFLQNSYNPIGQFDRRENDFHSMTGAQMNSEDISIQFDTGERFLDVYQRKNKAGISKTTFSYRNPYRFNSNLNVTQQQAISDIKDNTNGASTSVDLDDKMTQNYQRLNVYLNKYRKENNLTDKQATEQVLGELNAIFSECLGLKFVDHGDIMAGRGTMFFIKPDQPKEFNFNVLSSGEKEVVDLLLDIFLKKDDFIETIYLIDEPELHLNTAIQKKVLLAIERLIPDSCQIWIATHSIGFLNALQNELKDKSDIIDFYDDLTTRAVVVAPMVKNRANWQKIFKTALEDLTGLLAPRVIVYCEGRPEPSPSGEEQGLDADIYNQIFSEKYPDALFVSSGGNTTPEKYSAVALKVLGKAFGDVKLLLLKDKDINADGRITTDQQRTDFIAKDPLLNRMLKRKEIENYLFDYEIVAKAYSISKEYYDGVITDIKGDVKSKTGDLMVLCGIHSGMNKDAFKRHLATFITPDTGIFQELDIILSLNPTS